MLYCFFATLPLYHKANEKAYVMYYTVINTALQAFENTQLVFSTFPLCTQMPIMLLSQSNIGLGFFICYINCFNHYNKNLPK